MDTQRLMLGSLIALLRKNGGNEKDILAALDIAKKLSYDEAIRREAGGEPTEEEPVTEISVVTSTGSYQTLASWTVKQGWIGLLSKISMACNDYTHGRFRLVINDKEKWIDKQLPASLTLSFPDLTIRGGKAVTIQGKSSDGSSFSMWGEISGKEVV